MQAGAPNRVEVAVVMRREPVSGPMSRWQSWRWVLADVLSGDALEALELPVRCRSSPRPLNRPSRAHRIRPAIGFTRDWRSSCIPTISRAITST